MLKSRLVLLFALSFLRSAEQDLFTREWKASWIATPGASPNGYGVYLFQKLIDMPAVPASLPVMVSADNRYKLFVNDSLVSIGPARGDVQHWNYATVDLAPWLHAGTNHITAQVWNEGPERTEAQISYRTGFILQAASPEGSSLNTDTSWLTVMDSSYSPIRVRVPGYYVAGPGQLTDMNKQVTGRTSAGYPAITWKHAQAIAPGVPRNIPTSFASTTAWMLTPSTLPPMQLTRQRIPSVRRAEGITIAPDWPRQPQPVTIPANSQATILFDQSSLTNAYPYLVFSGGRNARLSLTYAEALYSQVPVKGNRYETDGKIFIGRKDSILSDGNDRQVFTTLTWRTWRYIQLRIVTGDQPLVLNDIYGTFVGYPFEQRAQFNTSRPELDSMLAIGWHTARLCAIETYMDCPYYEQLQYVGDTRIQALVSLYNSGDDRLVKNAIDQIDESRRPEGVTLSRYPTQMPQLIPPFSLWWIGITR